MCGMAKPENKIDEIKNAGLGISQRELVNVFGPKASGNLTAADIQKMHQDMPGALARKQADDEVFGIHDGLMARSGHFSEHQRKLIERLKGEGRADNGFNILLLDALQNNALPTFIADQVFDGMSDDDITTLVADIEDKTGRPFEAYAKDILGDDLPERNAGESDVDYQRRVLKELTEEMLNPDGSVKSEYADDPLAAYLAEQEVVQEVRAKAQSIQAEVEITGVTAKLEEETEDLASTSFNAAATAADEIDNAELVKVATEGQDHHSDEGLTSEESIDRANTGFANIPGMPGSA